MPADLLTRWGRPGGRRERDESNDDFDEAPPLPGSRGTAMVCSGDGGHGASDIPSPTTTASEVPSSTATSAAEDQRASTRVFYSPCSDRPAWDLDLFDSDAEWEED